MRLCYLDVVQNYNILIMMNEAAQGRVYRLLGVGPVSKASYSVRICALNHFEAFLECKGMPRLKDLTEYLDYKILEGICTSCFSKFMSLSVPRGQVFLCILRKYNEIFLVYIFISLKKQKIFFLIK